MHEPAIIKNIDKKSVLKSFRAMYVLQSRALPGAVELLVFLFRSKYEG